MNKIDSFRGEYEFLSNFSPSLVVVDGEIYATIEHAFQAAKTDDPTLKTNIRNAATPKEAKRLGRSVQLIKDWDQRRLDVMASLVNQKFDTHLDLKIKLLLTGDAELVEGNTWKDRYWGVTQDGVGENHLGKILMRTRDSLRAREGGALSVFYAFLNKNELGFMGDKFKDAIDLLRKVLDDPNSSTLLDGWDSCQVTDLVESLK